MSTFIANDASPIARRFLASWAACVSFIAPLGAHAEIKWAGSTIYVTPLLEGQPVAVEEAEDGLLVRYFDTPLGMIDPKAKSLRPIKPGKTRTPNV